MSTLTADELEQGDKLRDIEGHKKTNKYGPDYTDKIIVKKRWADSSYDRWDIDSWLFAPLCTNGRTASDSFTVSFDEINARISTGRYQPVDCEINRTLNIDELQTDTDTEIYIRFGDIPENEQSYNKADDCYEDGVSVYKAEIMSVPPESDAAGMFVPIGSKTLQILMLAQRETYLVTGNKVGIGNDGEPLLQNVETISKLKRGEKANGWVKTDN